MEKMTRILLEDCRGDRYKMLSHLYQIWRKPFFRNCILEGDPIDGEEFPGISIKPGIEEIPFCLLTAQLPVRNMRLMNRDVLLQGTLASGKIQAACRTESSAIALQTIKDEIGMLRNPRTHVKPDSVEEKVSLRRDMKDPLCQLFDRARKLPFFKDKLYVALYNEEHYTLCGQALPAGSQGAFYAFDRAARAFVAYDTYSDRLVCYGPVKSVSEIQ